MRFLVTSKPATPAPPDALPFLLNGLQAWANELTSSGKMEQVWSFAGIAGGGGNLDVDSLEELDQIMGAFPMAPSSEVEIHPLVDLNASLDAVRQSLATAAHPQPTRRLTALSTRCGAQPSTQCAHHLDDPRAGCEAAATDVCAPRRRHPHRGVVT